MVPCLADHFLVLPVTSTEVPRQAFGNKPGSDNFKASSFETTLIDQASSCFSWKEHQWIEQSGRHSMQSWIAPMLLHVRFLVMASFCGVADSAPQAPFRGVVDSACGNAREHV